MSAPNPGALPPEQLPSSARVMWAIRADGMVVPVLASTGGALAMAVDQTTDGTSNRVTPPLTIPVTKTGVLTIGTSYAVQKCIGGKITVSGLTPNTPYLIRLVHLLIGATTFTTGSSNGVGFRVFEGDPSGSTYTDNATPVLVAADILKLVYSANIAALAANGNQNNEPSAWGVNPNRTITADAGGNIYLAFENAEAAITMAMTAPFASWRVDLLR